MPTNSTRRRFILLGLMGATGCTGLDNEDSTDSIGDGSADEEYDQSRNGYDGSQSDEPITAEAEQWRFDRYDIANTSNNPHATPPTSDFEVIWEHESAVSPWASSSDGMSLAGDRLYVSAFNRRVFAADTESGKKIWETTLDGDLSQTPVSLDNAVLLVSDKGTLYALEPGSGEVKWQSTVNGWMASEFGPPCPTVHGETLYVHAADGTLSALDIADGDDQWTIEDVPTPGVPIGSPPVLDGVLFSNSSQEVAAFDLSTQENVWRYHSELEVTSPLVVTEEYVLCTTIYPETILAVSRENGEVAWQKAFDKNSFISTPSVDSDSVYLNTTHTTYSLSLDDGESVWESPIHGGINGGTTPVVAGEDVLIVKSTTGLSVVDRGTGEQLWSVTPGPVYGTVAVGDVVFVSVRGEPSNRYIMAVSGV